MSRTQKRLLVHNAERLDALAAAALSFAHGVTQGSDIKDIRELERVFHELGDDMNNLGNDLREDKDEVAFFGDLGVQMYHMAVAYANLTYQDSRYYSPTRWLRVLISRLAGEFYKVSAELFKAMNDARDSAQAAVELRGGV